MNKYFIRICDAWVVLQNTTWSLTAILNGWNKSHVEHFLTNKFWSLWHFWIQQVRNVYNNMSDWIVVYTLLKQ